MASKASDNESKIKVTAKKNYGGKPSSGTIKLKKPPPKHNKPGNWHDGSISDEEKTTVSSSTFPSSPGPVVNLLEDTARESFPTGRPLEDQPDLTRCTICKKIILKSICVSHVTECNRLKKLKLQLRKEQKEAREREKREAGHTVDDNDENEDYKNSNSTRSAKKGAGKKSDSLEERKGKKRKADADIDKAPRPKKKKEEPKPKFQKPRGPVNVERQCGVIKDGVPCARSLTCKSHSMGAKRAVAGRSLPYDFLLAAYQKKNQAKIQKAVIDANAPLEDDDPASGPIDSDEELSAVMQGLSNWNPSPGVLPIVQIPIERRYMRERLHEQLSQATNGFTLNIFKVKLAVEDERHTEVDWSADEDVTNK